MGLFEDMEKIFSPKDFLFVNAVFLKDGKPMKRYNSGQPRRTFTDEEPAEYVNYTIEELVDAIRTRVEHADIGDSIDVDMGITVLSATVVLDSEEYDPGDGYINPPYSSQTYRLEDVSICEQDGTHREEEEYIISKIIF